jgi:predicted DsbA family dithiol-disulfide isomerase/uncharacterized membrane protein
VTRLERRTIIAQGFVKASTWLLAFRVTCLLALMVSGALFVDYRTLDPSFCSAGSGCAQVRGSGFGYLFGTVPVPVIGLMAFGTLLVASLNSRSRPLLVPLSIVGGIAAIALIVLQAAVIRSFCWLCVVVDIAAIVLAPLALLAMRAKDKAQRGDLTTTAWLALAAIAGLAPQLWHAVRPEPRVPAGIRALYRPEKINVVEFADFECPHCRALHPRLHAIVREYGDRVNFKRLNLPLKSHPHAQDAARAAVCAEAQGKGAEMADALFEAEDVSSLANRRLAATLGLDVRRFAGCLTDPATDSRIEREANLLRNAGLKGLPTVYIGGRTVIGAQPDEVLRDAFERAARGADDRGVPAPLYATLVLAATAAVVWFGRRSSRTAPQAAPAGELPPT